MVTLKQICSALENLNVLGGDKDAVLEKLNCAINAAEDALNSMEYLQVCTRGCVDTLLGCMMATEAIIGEDGNGK